VKVASKFDQTGRLLAIVYIVVIKRILNSQ